MKCYGVDRNIKNLISETLTNQTMEVVVNGDPSELVSVDYRGPVMNGTRTNSIHVPHK
mgnify:CR=1 FL=1